jgi:DNA-directed RNA polymerase specialized sigma24 family protein
LLHHWVADLRRLAREDVMRTGSSYTEVLPSFITLIDTNPTQAWVGLHEFAWGMLTTHPPAGFRGLTRDEREDVISELVERLRRDGFAKLRKYRNIGRPFANWLLTVADRFARSRLRARRAVERRHVACLEVDGTSRVAIGVAPADLRVADRVEAGDLLEKVRASIQALDPKDQVLVQGAADGYKPRELAALVGTGADNKQISDRLRYVRKRLRHELAQQGVVI